MGILSATLLTPTPLLADAQPTLGPMTQKQGELCARLRQLGFKLGEPMKLYGERYKLLGDPIVSGDNSVFVAAVDKKSGKLRSLRIPMLVVKMAMESVPTRERSEKKTQRVDVIVEKGEGGAYEGGAYETSPFTRDARSRHHVEEVVSRVLAKRRTNMKRFTLGDADQKNGDTNERWH